MKASKLEIDHQVNQFHLHWKASINKSFYPSEKSRDIHSKYIKYDSPFSLFLYAHELLHH